MIFINSFPFKSCNSEVYLSWQLCQWLGRQHENILFCNFPGLTTFPEWITNQRLLQTLDLYDCNNLKSLPEGFQHLTALRHLEITGCHPELYRRCQKNSGEDWYKIAHIPELFIRSPAMGANYSNDESTTASPAT